MAEFCIHIQGQQQWSLWKAVPACPLLQSCDRVVRASQHSGIGYVYLKSIKTDNIYYSRIAFLYIRQTIWQYILYTFGPYALNWCGLKKPVVIQTGMDGSLFQGAGIFVRNVSICL